MGQKQLTIRLTTGWNSAPSDATGAADKATQDTDQDELIRQLENQNPDTIVQLDQLFHRRVKGFAAINKFIGNMAELEPQNKPICKINVFAYAFLKHAKNYDFFIKIEPVSHDEIQISIKQWRVDVQALEDFERLGKPLPDDETRKTYLKLRAIVGRASARDEQRALACLLIAGPSNDKDIQLDLNLNYPLSQRIMAALVGTGTITQQKHGDENHYALNDETLPMVFFLIRETIGLDMLALMTDMEGERL